MAKSSATLECAETRRSLPVEKIDVRLVKDAHVLHCLSQIRGLGKCLCSAEIRCLKKEDDFICIASAPKKMLLGEARLGALWQMRVVAALPFRKIGRRQLSWPLGVNYSGRLGVWGI